MVIVAIAIATACQRQTTRLGGRGWGRIAPPRRQGSRQETTVTWQTDDRGHANDWPAPSDAQTTRGRVGAALARDFRSRNAPPVACGLQPRGRACIGSCTGTSSALTALVGRVFGDLYLDLSCLFSAVPGMGIRTYCGCLADGCLSREQKRWQGGGSRGNIREAEWRRRMDDVNVQGGQ